MRRERHDPAADIATAIRVSVANMGSRADSEQCINEVTFELKAIDLRAGDVPLAVELG